MHYWQPLKSNTETLKLKRKQLQSYNECNCESHAKKATENGQKIFHNLIMSAESTCSKYVFNFFPLIQIHSILMGTNFSKAMRGVFLSCIYFTWF